MTDATDPETVVEKPPRRIVDCHCHIASIDHIPRSFIDSSISNVIASLSAQGLAMPPKKLSEMYDKKMQDPLCDALVEEMTQAGIEKSILLIADFTYALKDCNLTIEEAYHKHREVLTRHPGKFEVFGGVDPRWGKDGLDLFERSLAEFHFRGLKLYPPCGFDPSSPALFPYYELCRTYGVPVLIHIGPTAPILDFTWARPFLIDEASRRFPSVNFILAHGAVSFTEECVMLCRFRPNIYLDVSGFQSTLGWDPGCNAIRHITSLGINHKILFGTDWPVFRLQGAQQGFVDAVAGPDAPLFELSEKDQNLILSENIERIAFAKDKLS
jgi:uncharacterized protein